MNRSPSNSGNRSNSRANAQDRSHIMNSLSRGSVPTITPVATPDGTDYVLGSGPVGNEGAFDCYWGEFMRRACITLSRARR